MRRGPSFLTGTPGLYRYGISRARTRVLRTLCADAAGRLSSHFFSLFLSWIEHFFLLVGCTFGRVGSSFFHGAKAGIPARFLERETFSGELTTVALMSLVAQIFSGFRAPMLGPRIILLQSMVAGNSNSCSSLIQFLSRQ